MMSGKELFTSSIQNESFQLQLAANSSLTVNQQLELFVTVAATEAFQATRQKPGETERELVHLKGTIATQQLILG
ncbi:mCG146817 [Mus musculus]|nr:mCG146817 [Mus musculus]